MENENKLKNRNVETYTDDMVKAIENDKGGLIKKIIHEEEEHEAEKIDLSPRSRKNRLFMFISIVFIFSALAILVFLAFFDENSNIVQVAPQFTPIVFTDQSNIQAIDGFTKEKIAETVLNQVNNTKVKVGEMEGIYLTENKKAVGFKRFIALIKGNFILDQIDFVHDNFLFGAVNNEVKNLFILLKVRSFTDVFLAMHSWEDKMLYDLYGFFGTDISPETNYLFTKNWQDGIVQNKNARILKDKDKKIVLMYVFINDSSIVITNSETAVREVILRLTFGQIKK